MSARDLWAALSGLLGLGEMFNADRFHERGGWFGRGGTLARPSTGRRDRTPIRGPAFRYRVTDPCFGIDRHDPAYKRRPF